MGPQHIQDLPTALNMLTNKCFPYWCSFCPIMILFVYYYFQVFFLQPLFMIFPIEKLFIFLQVFCPRLFLSFLNMIVPSFAFFFPFFSRVFSIISSFFPTATDIYYVSTKFSLSEAASSIRGII